MAHDILTSVTRQKSQSYHYRHDLESFVYVLVYAIVKKEHRLLVDQDKADAEIAKSLRKARLSGTATDDDGIAEEDIPLGPNGEPLLTPLEQLTKLLSDMFGRSSFGNISRARSHLRTSWDDFMLATKGRSDPNYIDHPTRLHWIIVNFLTTTARQNIKPLSEVYGDGTKRSRHEEEQVEWLNGQQMLAFLERQLKLQEEGVVMWGDNGEQEQAQEQEQEKEQDQPSDSEDEDEDED
jgi:hypothetical protein